MFITLTFCSGLGFYNHAVTLQALVSEKNMSVAIASSSVSIFFLTSGIFGFWISSLLEKFDIRWIITAGAVLAAGALQSIRYLESEWQVMTAFSVFGAGFAASGLLPATTLIARWFQEKRALALSITSTGLSVGGIVITPASALLIEDYGIDTALSVFAAAYLVGVIPLTTLFLKSWPDQDATIEPANDPRLSGIDLKSAMKERYFWGLSFAYTFLMMAQVGALAHQYGLVAEHLSGPEAAMALGVIPITSIIGRLVGGVLLGRFSATRFTLVMIILQSVSLLMLSQVSAVWALVVGLGLFGISVGNLLMLQPLLIAERYGQIQYGRIYGLSNMMTTFGLACGPLFLGLIFAASGSYSLPYLTASAAGLLGWVVFRWAMKPN